MHLMPSAMPAICLPTDLTCLAKDAAGGAFEAMVDMLGSGVVLMTKYLSTFWLNMPSPEIAEGSGMAWTLNSKIAQMQLWLSPLTAMIALISFAFALGRMAWHGDFREGQGVMRQVSVVAAGSLLPAATIQIALLAGDVWSTWVVEKASNGSASEGMKLLITAGLNGGNSGGQAGLWFFLFLFMGLGALVQCLFMAIRGPVLWLLQIYMPATAAGTASEEGWHRYKRYWLIMIAAALYKPVAASVYAGGLLLMTHTSDGGSSNDVGAAVNGLTIMLLAAAALPALLKFLVPMAAMGSSSAFSGGAAVGAIAGGAAIIATVGATAAGAGAPAAAGAMGAGASRGGSPSGPGGAPTAPPDGGSGGGGGGGGGAQAVRGAAGLAQGAAQRASTAEPEPEEETAA